MDLVSQLVRVSVLFVLSNSIHAISNETQYTQLIFMAPSNSDAAHTLNQKNSLTNTLRLGWVFQADTQIDMLFFINPNVQINHSIELTRGFVFFTPHISSCDPSAHSSSLIFKLDFPTTQSHLPKHGFLKHRLKRIKKNSTLLIGKAAVTFKYSPTNYYSCLKIANRKEAKFVHQGSQNIFTHVITEIDLLPIYVVVIVYFILLAISALCSGLNIGLMSLDLTELNILKKIGTAKEKFYARKIYPLRRHGNLLLCSILLGCTLVNAVSTLILGNYFDGLYAAIGSTLFIVVFGEIIPQAAVSKYALAIGARTRFVMYAIMGITFVAAYPLSKLLDCVLGKEIAKNYSRDKVRELMRRARDEKKIEEKQFKLIAGALDFKSKTVGQIMVPVSDVFSLDINTMLDFDAFKTILFHNYSRIPIYEFTK